LLACWCIGDGHGCCQVSATLSQVTIALFAMSVFLFQVRILLFEVGTIPSDSFASPLKTAIRLLKTGTIVL
jgi:hypothetical protein